jgi:hypothetical protein
LLLLVIVSIAGAQNPGPRSGNAIRAGVGTGASAPLSASFTYQGHLQNGGAPVNDVCDFQFSLWDAAGSGTVLIEPMFAQTVNLTETYHVFLTPLGDCPLYVAEKSAQSFTVKAMGGQTCGIAFDYRIVAKRLGYETLRLEPATLDTAEESDKWAGNVSLSWSPWCYA